MREGVATLWLVVAGGMRMEVLHRSPNLNSNYSHLQVQRREKKHGESQNAQIEVFKQQSMKQ